MTKEDTSDNIWRLPLQIPVRAFETGLKYQFVATVHTYYAGSLISLKSTVQSEWNYFTDSTVDRMILKPHSQNPGLEDLLYQFRDIVINTSKSLPISDCVRQLEDFSSKYYISYETAQELCRHLLDLIDKKSSEQHLLMIIVIGNVFNNINGALKILKDDERDRLIESVPKCQFNISSKKKVIKFISELCIQKYGKESYFLRFVLITFPNVDETQLSTLFDETIIKQRCQLVPQQTEKQLEKEILGFFKTLYNRSHLENARSCLCQFLRYTPVSLAVKVLVSIEETSELKPSENDNMFETVLQCVYDLLKDFIKGPKRQLEELIEVWEIVKAYDPLVNLGKNDLEQVFARFIQSSNETQIVQLRPIINDKILFQSTYEQRKLIECLATRHTLGLHFHLLDIVTEQKFTNCSRTELKWFDLSYAKVTEELKKERNLERKMKGLYEYMSKVLDVSVISESNELQKSLTDTAVDILKPSGVQCLLKHVHIIQNFSKHHPRVEEMFRQHIELLLLDRPSQNYNELLVTLCELSGEIDIHSR